MSLEDLFDRERNRLWARLQLLAESHGGVGGLFSREGDPRVGHIVEASAYGFARIRELLSGESPDEGQTVIGTALPETLRPTPAMTIAKWHPSLGTESSATGPRAEVELRSTPVDGSTCYFQTVWPITSSCVRLEAAAIDALGAGRRAVRIRLRVTGGIPMDVALCGAVRLFIESEAPARALDIVRALCCRVSPVSLLVLDAGGEVLRAVSGADIHFAPSICDERLRLLPGRLEAFRSHGLLRAFFSFPELFGFVDVLGLSASLHGVGNDARSLELVVPLEHGIEAPEATVTFHLHCTPAVNFRRATAAAMRFDPTTSSHRLRVDSEPDADIYEVEGIRTRAEEGASVPLRLWERDDGQLLRREEVTARIARQATPGSSRTSWDVHLSATGDQPLVRPCVVEADLIITDGRRTDRLGIGTIRGAGNTSEWTNLTRVTRYTPVALDRKLPWRLNAYARIAAPALGTVRGIRGLLESLDNRENLAEDPHRTAAHGVTSVHSAGFRRAVNGAVHGGDLVAITLDPGALGGHGTTWMLGELLARALAERTDILRYSHVRWVSPDGTTCADYGMRQGECLPFPLG